MATQKKTALSKDSHACKRIHSVNVHAQLNPVIALLSRLTAPPSQETTDISVPGVAAALAHFPQTWGWIFLLGGVTAGVLVLPQYQPVLWRNVLYCQPTLLSERKHVSDEATLEIPAGPPHCKREQTLKFENQAALHWSSHSPGRKHLGAVIVLSRKPFISLTPSSSGTEEGAPCTRSAQCQMSTGFHFGAEEKSEEFLNMDNMPSLDPHRFTLALERISILTETQVLWTSAFYPWGMFSKLAPCYSFSL